MTDFDTLPGAADARDAAPLTGRVPVLQGQGAAG